MGAHARCTLVLSQRLHDILKDELRAASHTYQNTFVCMFTWVTIPSCLTGAVSFVPVMSWGCNPRQVYNHRTSPQIRTPMYLLIPILPYRPHYIFVDFYMHASPLGRLLALFGGAHEEGRFARAENRFARAQTQARQGAKRTHMDPAAVPKPDITFSSASSLL